MTNYPNDFHHNEKDFFDVRKNEIKLARHWAAEMPFNPKDMFDLLMTLKAVMELTIAKGTGLQNIKIGLHK